MEKTFSLLDAGDLLPFYSVFGIPHQQSCYSDSMFLRMVFSCSRFNLTSMTPVDPLSVRSEKFTLENWLRLG